jgi:hypothetical protein
LSSDLPGVNPATLNRMILYYRLMTKWSGLGDSTELSRMGLSHIKGDLEHHSGGDHFPHNPTTLDVGFYSSEA